MEDARRLADRALEHIRHLVEGIGPRGSTTAEERRAAEYARDVLLGLGLEARVEPFLAPRSTYRPFLLAFGAALFGGLLYAVAPQPATALLASALSALGAWGMYAELDFRAHWMGRLLPRAASQNVVGVLPAAEAARRRVVLIAHADTHRTPVFYSSTLWHRLFVGLVGATLAGLALGSLAFLGLALVSAAGPLRGALLGLAGVAAALQLFGFVMCLHADATPYSPGANDNGSGAGCLLALAEELAAQPLRWTEVWVVIDGCEEVGAYGARALAAAHGEGLRGAWFLGVDQVGAGDPGFLTSDGLLKRYPADPDLLALCRKVATRHPDLRARGHANLAYTDLAVLLKGGFRGLTVDAVPPHARGALHWHQMSDTLERLEPDCLRRVLAFVRALLDEMDQADAPV